jgi:hypothetical protein
MAPETQMVLATRAGGVGRMVGRLDQAAVLAPALVLARQARVKIGRQIRSRRVARTPTLDRS